MKAIGIILIVLGIFGVLYGGFSYITREEIFDFGPVSATQERRNTVPIPPIVGIIAIVGGIALLASGRQGGGRRASDATA